MNGYPIPVPVTGSDAVRAQDAARAQSAMTTTVRAADPFRTSEAAGLADIGVAIGIPEPYRTQLQDWRERLGDPNAALIVPHVTLLGPTTVRVADLPAIETHLARAAGTPEPFTILLRGSGTFRPLSPVVFVAVVAGATQCASLAAAVRSGPLERPLTFDYHPHVTVAHDIPADGLDRAYAALAEYQARFEVCGFGLYRRGADQRWRPLRFFAFGAPGTEVGAGSEEETRAQERRRRGAS